MLGSKQATNPELFAEWKQNAHYTKVRPLENQTAEMTLDRMKFYGVSGGGDEFEVNKQKFFAATEHDDRIAKETLTRTLAMQPTFEKLVEDEFKMTTKVQKFGNPLKDQKNNFQTSNTYYQEITDKSQEGGGLINDPNIAKGKNKVLRHGDVIWRRETYSQPEYRKDLTATSNRKNMIFEVEEARKVHEDKHNYKKTAISEYSNAKHNKEIFLNPKFSSC